MEVILKHRLIQRELTCSLGFLGSSPGKGSACNAGDLSSIPGSGSSPGEGIDYPLQYSQASLVAQKVKNLSAMHKTWVQSLGREDPLEEGMATHSSILAWRIPMDRGAQQATVHGVTESDTTERLSTAHSLCFVFQSKNMLFLMFKRLLELSVAFRNFPHIF